MKTSRAGIRPSANGSARNRCCCYRKPEMRVGMRRRDPSA
jgi:hypothetical protein